MTTPYATSFNSSSPNPPDTKDLGKQLLAVLDKPDANEFKALELIHKGADLSVTDDDGNDALNLAAFWGHIVATAGLLSAKANRNRPNHAGMTPVMSACAAGQVNTACMIATDPFCRLDVRDNHGRSAADCAKDNDHYSLGDRMEREAVKKSFRHNPSRYP